MSAFLHQLARRAMRSEFTMHSRARLPYAELAMRLEPASPLTESGSLLRSRQSSTGGKNEGDEPETAQDSPRASLQGRKWAAAAPDKLPVLHQRRLELEAAERSAAGALPVSDAARDFAPLVHAPPDIEQRVAHRRDAVRQTTAGDARTLDKDRVLSAEHSPVFPAAEIRPGRNSGSPPAHRPGRSAAAHRLVREASSGEPLPDIHISIGRIEVTAAVSPTPKRAPPRAHETMPLQKYLERRGREPR